jgi:hypothetical protein
MAHTKIPRPSRLCRSVAQRRIPDWRQRAAAAPPRPYDRRTDLPRVLPLWPRELDDESPQGRLAVLSKLRRALRAERCRGIAGNWTYDLARHAELLRVYRHELAASGLPDIARR